MKKYRHNSLHNPETVKYYVMILLPVTVAEFNAGYACLLIQTTENCLLIDRSVLYVVISGVIIRKVVL